MQIIKKYDKYSHYLFNIAMLIHIVIMCVGFSEWEVPFRGRLLQLAFCLCVVKILLTYYERIEWTIMIMLGILACASYYFSREKYVVYVVVLVFAAKSVDLKWILKVLLYGCITTSVIIPILAVSGIGGTWSETRDFGREIIETRYQMGFSHANNVHGTLWYILSWAIVIYKDRLDWRHYTGFTVFNIVMFILTASKAGVGVTQIVILAGLLYKYANRVVWEKKYVYILGTVAFVGVVALTLVSMKVDCFADYGPVLRKLDSITTGRLNIAYQSAYIGDIRLLGEGGSHIIPIDNGFASLAADFGWIIWGVYLIFTLYLIYMTGKKKDGILFCLIITCIIYTFMEETFVLNDAYLLGNVSYLVAMILLGEKKPAQAKDSL